MSLRVVALDHVQLAMPAGGEELAEQFYCGLLGFTVVAKPAPLAGRGGRWFASGSVQVHLGVDPEFRAARKAHPALVVEDLDAATGTLLSAGHRWVADEAVAGSRRGFTEDPFGNRIELIERARS
jgi:catechol 2,3-dioxygenase-like lactoylglutathione lyase family enzyme